MSSGDWHICTLVAGGGVDCWGWNKYGQLGTGDMTNRLTPTMVSGLGSGGDSCCDRWHILEILQLFGRPVLPSGTAGPLRCAQVVLCRDGD